MSRTTRTSQNTGFSPWQIGAAAAGAALTAAAAWHYVSRSGAGQGAPGRSRDRRRPSWNKLLGEFPAGLRLMAEQLAPAPAVDPGIGRGRAVLVIPGLLAHDWATIKLRRTLEAAGFRPFGWNNGFNLGARRDLFETLEARLDEIVASTGGPVILVGWSLGGLYARELAKLRPADVSDVVTLGTPFSVDMRDNNAWKLYEAINDHRVDEPPLKVDPGTKPPVRTVAIWSSEDGIVAPASASGAPWQSDEQRRVSCNHNELVSDPEALNALLVVLDKD